MDNPEFNIFAYFAQKGAALVRCISSLISKWRLCSHYGHNKPVSEEEQSLPRAVQLGTHLSCSLTILGTTLLFNVTQVAWLASKVDATRPVAGVKINTLWC